MNNQLVVYTRTGVSLEDAVRGYVKVAGGSGAIGLLYTPQQCLLARLQDGAWCGPDGHPIRLDAVFEARGFNELAELRWLRDPGPDRAHQAVILAEKDRLPGLDDWSSEPLRAIVHTIAQTYLLWGEGTGRRPADGWSELATARIGALCVPVAGVQQHQRVLLHAREYVTEGDHGNAVVIEERLLRLEIANA